MSIRFAILGAGRIAHQFAHAVSLVDSAELVFVASKSPERAAAFAEKHGIPASGSYDELISYNAQHADSPIDCVYVATTHNFHADNIRLCLEAGLNVVCEKPMVLTEADAVSLFALAREKGLFLMEAMWSRFLPTIQWAKAKIEAGAIGSIISAVSVIGFRGDGDPESRLLKPELAGGALYDIGVYPLEIVSYLMGEPIESVQSAVRRHPVTGVDSCDSLIVRYPSAEAVIQCLFTGSPKEFILIHGTAGYIEIPGVSGSTRAALHGANRALIEEFHGDLEGGNGFVYEVREVIRCLREGETESPVMPAAASVECARVFEAVLG